MWVVWSGWLSRWMWVAGVGGGDRGGLNEVLESMGGWVGEWVSTW